MRPIELKAAVEAYLASTDGWLLIFDNVESPDVVREWAPTRPQAPVTGAT